MSGLTHIALEVLWTGTALVCCMLFDMLAMKRSGFAYIAPEGAPTIEPKFWTGWSIRHFLLVPISFLLQYLVRRQVTEISTMWVVTGCLVVCYAVFFVRDLFKQIRSRPNQ